MLEKYNKKRKFNTTPEPKGKKLPAGKSKPLSFVVQEHHASHLHYDFRLELEGVLLSWAVPKGPSMNPGDKRLAMMVEDHPISYGGFEGDIPKGNYGAGHVSIWDKGFYSSVQTAERKQSEKLIKAGLHKGHITFVIFGEKLKGEFALIKIKAQKSAKENAWLLVKADDQFAVNNSSATKTPKVAASVKVPMPQSVQPMLAKLTDQPFDDNDWIYENKWDGYRAIAEIQDKKVRLYSRNDNTFNAQFSPVVKELEKLKVNAILDGEVVALDSSGKPSFQLLQDYQIKKSTLVYYVFDLLYLDGKDLRELPLIKRKALLKNLVPKSKVLKFSEHTIGEGKKLFVLAKKAQLEGIIAKKADSPYRSGKRSAEWLKIKTHMRQEAIICGYTAPRGGRKGFGALILGLHQKNNLRYIGHTGGGFDDKAIKALKAKMDLLKISKSPFKVPPKTNAPATWVKPELVCEVVFQEWTDQGTMRQPIFLGLRKDKNQESVIKEQIEPIKKVSPKNERPSEFTHLDKIFWPKEKYTKGDLINYYRKISPYILPYLKDRPESMNRHPNGIDGQSFFQKDVGHSLPNWIETVEVFSESNQKNINYLVCQDQKTLLYMANLGCIEINPWSSRLKNLENPDYAVIDLDPGDISFDKVIEAAQTIHKVLEKAGAASYCKTSGATGLHIFIPLAAKYNYDQTKQFAEIVATIVQKKLPKTTSLVRSPSKRKKQIYLDFLQNRKGQTLAAAYSVRPRPGAPVSTPLEWKEVKKGLDPKNFNVKNIFARLAKKGDLWKPVLGKGIDLKKVLKNLDQ
ncbi:MAG: ATP-dependent ligase LigD phosphoesterase module / ATP-dependent ligase LigD polymerase [Candidatus Doudnabacteria bacterium]|nr:ATP-dependent ligase LigD phosphoesterase module / ATP-dependent ligase LigD polymerase [Candidatus Doudnabacteria bacterium]